MQAVLNNIEYSTSNLINLLSEADNSSKNEIENMIVNMGSNVVDELVCELKNLKGIARSIAAMSLIRIGDDSISALKKEAMKDNDFVWIANYLISEIECR